jgi:GTP-binding protein
MKKTHKHLPEILILGRPNVGKSTLVNRILKKNKAITFDTPGVTRDLLKYPITWHDKPFILVDSGGVLFQNIDLDQKNLPDEAYFQPKIDQLVRTAIEKADKLILIVDGRDGLNPLDLIIAKELRPYQSKLIIAVNKLDDLNHDLDLHSFYKLGLGAPTPISAMQGHGIHQLLENATSSFKNQEKGDDYPGQKTYKIALVGRPNVGKSSLTNAILNETRVLVDSKAGTTRDSIEVHFTQGETLYTFIDTAGLRKKSRVNESIEFYSTVRTQKAIDDADLVVVLLDANEFLIDQDKKIINQVLDSKKNMIIFVNKWDLTERTDDARKTLIKMAHNDLPLTEHYPFIFGSAQEKTNIGKLFTMIPQIITLSETRVPTGQFNQFIKHCMERHTPTLKSKGKRLKVYYATQAESAPPTFICFINHPKYLEPSYVRFIENQIRTEYGGFLGVPIQLHFKGKHTRSENNDTKINLLPR